MAITTAPELVAKPTSSMPLRYGLFTAANGPLDLPIHSRNGGLQYVEAMCGGGAPYEVECISAQNLKTFTGSTNTVLGAPFVAMATFTCGTVGYTPAELRAFAVEKLKSTEQATVEAAFSTGAAGAAPSLTAASGAVTVVGGGTTVDEVLSELERALYCTSQYGVPGVVHVPIPVFNAMKSADLVNLVGGRWVTALGTVVSTGCYAGNDPAGVPAADGTFWLYITGQTTVWRDPDSAIHVAPVEGTLDRTTNQQLMLAERYYVVAYECGIYAKAVTLW